MVNAVRLHSYWRSSCAYRVRICLHLKGIDYTTVPVNLPAGEQHQLAYLKVNPQGTVPALEIDGVTLTQSLAIIEYLERRNPQPPLLSGAPAAAAHVRTLAYAVAMDIQPVSNLRVVEYLAESNAVSGSRQSHWMRHWMRRGFDALEHMACAHGPFVAGATCSLADVCLVPQLYNAQRWQLATDAWARLTRSAAACAKLDAFAAALPENQPDAKLQ